jgi:hypothetical protein
MGIPSAKSKYLIKRGRPVRIGVALIIAALAVTTVFFFCRTPQPVKVFPVKGDFFLSGRDGTWIKKTNAVNIRAGDTLRTPEDGQIDIAADGKYLIRLKEESEIKMRESGKGRGGNIFFEIKKGRAFIDAYGIEGSTFRIRTPVALCGVRGTRFAVDSSEDLNKTWVGVLEGEVAVRNRNLPENGDKNLVLVKAGQKTEIVSGSPPLEPMRMNEREWRVLEELYGLGRKLKVILLVKNTPQRTRDLLAPCPVLIYDEEPRELPPEIETIVLKMKKALSEKSPEMHLKSAEDLENFLSENPNKKYGPQLLLFTGAYYYSLGRFEKAIDVFEKVTEAYPDSDLAGMEVLAAGLTYEEKLGLTDKADKAYDKVINEYYNTLEAIYLEEKLRKDQN